MISRRTLLLGTTALAVSAAGCSAAARPTATGTRPASPRPSTSPRPSATSPSPLATSPSPTPRPSTPSTTGTPRVTGTVAADLDVPWGIAFLPSGDALVSERNTARILRVTPAGAVTALGVVRGVQAPSGQGEGGLLGLALAPGDPETLFAYLTSREDNRVVRLSLAGGRVGRPRTVLAGIPTSTHHHGGRLLFDATGMLLVSTGDAEQPSSAQDRDSLAGKILRIRPDGRPAPGNPFGNHTWSYGHRNVQGLAVDAGGRLWATEFGDKAADELNLVVRGGNYGWPDVEGASTDRRYRPPATTWSPTSTSSPSGLAITRSTAVVAALQGQCLYAIPLAGTRAGRPRRLFAGDHGRLRTVALAPDGALWVTTSNTDGRVDPGRHDDRILRVTL